MGLFDMFGVGGGKLSLQPQSQQVQAGGTLAGTVTFQGGSRVQQVTRLTVKLVMDTTRMEQTPQGPQSRHDVRDAVPAQVIASNFQTTANGNQQFPFQIVVPAQSPATTPGVVKYRLVASADIDREVDPGANVEIQVLGGMPGAMGMAPGMPGAMGMAPGMPGAMGMMGAAAAMAPGMMQGMMPPAPPVPQGPPQIGQIVTAQWQDGSWHPGTVVAIQNGMIGVDWTSPALGQSSWVQPHQVQAQQAQAPMMAPPGMPGAPMGQSGLAPAGKGHDPYAAKGHAPHAAKGHDPYAAKGHEPNAAKGHDPYAAKGHEPNAAKGGGAVSMGAQVIAQWQDGQWYPGRVVGMQGTMVAVDWYDPNLGASVWLQAYQVRLQ